MLECLALEDACVQTVWNWIYENWSWGFFIAVVSLFFTARALKKTDKSNKLAEMSLALTKRSTDIANESLSAAKLSVDTSINIYNKQKAYSDFNKKLDRMNLTLAVKFTASKEAYMLMNLFVFFIDLKKILDSNIDKVNVELSNSLLWKNIYFINSDGNEISTDRVPEIPNYFSHETLINSALSSLEIFNSLSELNTTILTMDTIYNVMLNDLKRGDIDSVREIVNTIVTDGEEKPIKNMMSTVLVFEYQMSSFRGYDNCLKKIMDHINT